MEMDKTDGNIDDNGPHTLTPDETVKLVKDLRKRMNSNKWKINRQENKFGLSLAIILLSAYCIFLILIYDHDDAMDILNSCPYPRNVGLIGFLMMFIIMFPFIQKITIYVKRDAEFFYTSLLDRNAIVIMNLKKGFAILFFATIFVTCMAVPFLWFENENALTSDIILHGFIANLVTGSLLMALNIHARNVERDLMIRKNLFVTTYLWPKTKTLWVVILISLCYPFLLLYMIEHPFWILFPLILLIPVLVKGKVRLVAESNTHWYDDLVIPPFSIISQYYPVFDTFGYRRRELIDTPQQKSRVKKWWEKGPFDLYHFKQNENYVDFQAVVDCLDLNRKRMIGGHVEIFFVSFFAISILFSIRYHDKYFLFLSLFFIYCYIIMRYSVGILSDFSKIEKVYILPFESKKVILFVLKRMMLLFIFFPIIALWILTNMSDKLTLSRMIGNGLILFIFTIELPVVMMFSSLFMKNKPENEKSWLKNVRSMSLPIFMLGIIFQGFIVQFICILIDASMWMGLFIAILYGFASIFFSQYLYQKTIELYDKISL